MSRPELSDDRAEVLARIDLAALFTELVGPGRGPERSAMFPCPAPAHAQTGATPPVAVDRAKGLWHCHGCGLGGSAVDLLTVATGASVGDALAQLRTRAGLHCWQPPAPPRSRQEARHAPAPPVTPPIDPGAAERALGRFCAGRSWSVEVAEALGIHVVADAYGRPWVRFPFRVGGEVVTWQDRRLGAGSPKWLTPAGAKLVPYNLDALDQAHEVGSVIVVEGPADVVALHHAFERPSVVGIAGAAGFKAEWMSAFTGLAVYVVADNDEAGERLRADVDAKLAGIARSVWHLRVPEPHNDLDEWRQAGPERFAAELLAVVDALDTAAVA